MSAGKGNLTTGFYWIGVATTLACFALVLAGNTEMVWRFEHRGLHLSWVFGGAAIFAFLAGEFCDSAFFFPRQADDQGSQLSPEWEAAEPLAE